MQQPDLILLDIMPDMDSRATLRKIEGQSTDSARHFGDGQSTALAQTGIDPDQVVTVYAKPFRPLTLADQIRAILSWS
ncbi:response regulator transcription factor [Leptolyngbya sp. BC1307]|uniref:response regulator transcription factor n=1 Tax=Leptolyngbya sp. BC1307 TaxID=2029589 RepID=UPI000EFA7621|nr:response regulator transcription factor [Leptolyngbya sp. BC1307]